MIRASAWKIRSPCQMASWPKITPSLLLTLFAKHNRFGPCKIVSLFPQTLDADHVCCPDHPRVTLQPPYCPVHCSPPSSLQNRPPLVPCHRIAPLKRIGTWFTSSITVRGTG